MFAARCAGYDRTTDEARRRRANGRPRSIMVPGRIGLAASPGGSFVPAIFSRLSREKEIADSSRKERRGGLSVVPPGTRDVGIFCVATSDDFAMTVNLYSLACFLFTKTKY